MMPLRPQSSSTQSTRWVAPLVIGITLLVFGVALALSRQQLRQQIRQQIAGRDGEILLAMALQWQENGDPEANALASLDDPVNQFALALSIERHRGVMAVRLFDAQGKFFNASPWQVVPTDLHTIDVDQLKQLKPQSHFYPKARLEDYFLALTESSRDHGSSRPLLEVNVPLYQRGQTTLLGIAQFLIDGSSIAAEYAALDRHLLKQNTVIALTGAAVIGLVLGWAFYRMERMNRLLRERTTHLLRANQELSLAAKTSALGAVAAHLFHGLKNPLSGLHSLTVHRSSESNGNQEADWELAAAATKRMKAMVDEVVRVMRENEGTSQYELSVSELIELILSKIQPLAQKAGIHFKTNTQGDAIFTNREANLILLILDNLLRNAIQATPQGKTVTLSFQRQEAHLAFSVGDEGPGFPEELKTALFTPCRSTKEGGNGIGLAISKQLAQHLGADLTLAETSSAGCVFQLTIPVKISHDLRSQ